MRVFFVFLETLAGPDKAHNFLFNFFTSQLKGNTRFLKPGEYSLSDLNPLSIRKI